MQTLNQSLTRLVLDGQITLETALAHSSEPAELRTAIERNGRAGQDGVSVGRVAYPSPGAGRPAYANAVGRGAGQPERR
jgi:hypothetical protein